MCVRRCCASELVNPLWVFVLRINSLIQTNNSEFGLHPLIIKDKVSAAIALVKIRVAAMGSKKFVKCLNKNVNLSVRN